MGWIKRKNTCIPLAQYKDLLWTAEMPILQNFPSLSALGSPTRALGCSPACLTSCCKILKLIKYQKLWHFQQMLDVFTQIVNKPVPVQLWLATKAWQIVTAIFDSKTTKTFLSFLLSNNDCVELRLRCHKILDTICCCSLWRSRGTSEFKFDPTFAILAPAPGPRPGEANAK